MSRFRLFVLAALVVGLTGWLVTRNGKTAQAADIPAVAEASYGENTEDCATHRYVSGGAHHWRYVMLKR